jgi:hypothetical protein
VLSNPTVRGNCCGVGRSSNVIQVTESASYACMFMFMCTVYCVLHSHKTAAYLYSTTRNVSSSNYEVTDILKVRVNANSLQYFFDMYMS